MPSLKEEFKNQLTEHVSCLGEYVNTEDGQWTIKGFIDIFQNIYTISSDTKIISKVIEIHLFPKILEFSRKHGYKIILAEHQNHYPDISFMKAKDESVKFAVDFKTTYRVPNKPWLCSGLTLGSYGTYFQNRNRTKNIRFPYGSYKGHFCLGVIYDRKENIAVDEIKQYKFEQLKSITSVVNNFQFFIAEKWKIASDKSGSGNTTNIGSINRIEDIVNERGMFSKLGEGCFDDYWMNFKKITKPDGKGGTKRINTLKEFLEYRKGDSSLIVPKDNRPPVSKDVK